MIQKIQNREYLRRFDNMDAKERAEVMTAVGRWLSTKSRQLRRLADDASARLQNVLQVSVMWNDADCEAWQEGVRLLSAWGVGLDRGWWPDGLYAKSAKRSIGWLIATLTEKSEKGKIESEKGTVKSEKGKVKSEKSEPLSGGDAIAGQQTKKQGADDSGKETQEANVTTPLPARPRHIDQYAHLLPEKTQQRAQEYGPLMRELDAAREKMRLLMDDPYASAPQREQWAKRAVALEKKAKGILQELDREWENIVKQGKVAVDALGMAYVVDVPQKERKEQKEPQAAGEVIVPQKEQKSQKDGKPSAEDLRKAGLLRKWLIDTRYGNTAGKRADRYRNKWIENYRLMIKLGGKEAVTDKVVAAAKHYGIDLSTLADTSDTSEVTDADGKE